MCRLRNKKGRITKQTKSEIKAFMLARSYNKGACRSLKEWQKVKLPGG